MTSYIPIILCLVFVFYSIASISYFFPKSEKFTNVFVIIAFILHTFALCFFYDAINALPSSNIYGLIEVMGWGCAVVSIMGIALKINALKKLPLLAATILTIMPLCCPVFSQNVSMQKPPSSLVIQMHAFFAALSYAMMFTGLIVSLAYLHKSSKLKNKVAKNKPSAISLEALNKAVKISVLSAAITMIISIILGICGIPSIKAEYPLLIKIIIGSSIFAVQIYIAVNIIFQNIKATALAKVTAILLVLSIIALFSIELRRLFL